MCIRDSVVGMAEARHRSASQLSGGQKQRIGIASVLAMLPQVLVLDEPTAELDPVGRREITQVVADLRAREAGMTVVMVERGPDGLAPPGGPGGVPGQWRGLPGAAPHRG